MRQDCLLFSMFLKRSCWYQAGNREAKYAESVILLSIFRDLGGGVSSGVGCGVFFDGRGYIFIWSRVRARQPDRLNIQKVMLCLIFSRIWGARCAEMLVLLNIFKDLRVVVLSGCNLAGGGVY